MNNIGFKVVWDIYGINVDKSMWYLKYSLYLKIVYFVNKLKKKFLY